MQSDLISRRKLKSAISREDGVIIDGYRYIRASAVLEKINASPGVDAVEVVRCRECRYYSGCNDKPGEVTAIGYCNHLNHHILPMTADRYCADARRKDGGDPE